MNDLEITKSEDGRGRLVMGLQGTVKAAPRALWELFADTQRLNSEVYGLPPVENVEQHADGARATLTIAGVALAFDEKPWVFEAPRRYRNMRTFAAGPFERIEANCAIDDVAAGATLDYRVTVTTRTQGPIAKGAELLLAQQLERGFTRLQQLASSLAAGQSPSPFVHPDHAQVRARAARFEGPLRQAGHDAVLVEGLLQHIANAGDDDVERIRPYALAESWQQPREHVLALCLDAVGAGLLQMRWETICPSCRGPIHESATLYGGVDVAGAGFGAPETHTCALCQISVDASRMSNVAAVFQPVFDVRRAARGVYCLGSPRRTPHWLAQLVVDAGGRDEIRAQLSSGRYVVQSPGIDVRCVVDVGATGDERARIVLEGPRGTRGPTLPAATPNVKSGTVVIAIENADARARRVQLVNESFGDLAATAAHVVETEAWRRLSSRR